MDERAYNRVLVDLEVAARVGTRSMRVSMYDLSMDGCLIESSGDTLPSASSEISLYIPELNVARGTLVWTKGKFGGVKFAERLHEAWVRHLGFKPRPSEMHFRDQFGRPVSIPGERFDVSR